MQDTKHKPPAHALLDALIEDIKRRQCGTAKPGQILRANDAAVARALEVAPPVISKIRHNNLAVGDVLRVRIQREFGWPLKKIDELAPPAEKA